MQLRSRALLVLLAACSTSSPGPRKDAGSSADSAAPQACSCYCGETGCPPDPVPGTPGYCVCLDRGSVCATYGFTPSTGAACAPPSFPVTVANAACCATCAPFTSMRSPYFHLEAADGSACLEGSAVGMVSGLLACCGATPPADAGDDAMDGASEDSGADGGLDAAGDGEAEAEAEGG